MFWISTGFLALCFVSLSIYWKNPEWITEEIEEPATLEDIEINNADLSKTGEVNREQLVPDGTQQQINPNQSSDEAIALDDNIALESETLAEQLRREQEFGTDGSGIVNPDGLFFNPNTSKSKEIQTEDWSNSIKSLPKKSAAENARNFPSYSSLSQIKSSNQPLVDLKAHPLQDALNNFSTDNSWTNLEQSGRRASSSITKTSNSAKNSLSNEITNYRSFSQNNSSSSPSPTSLPSYPNYLNNSSTLGNFTSQNQRTNNAQLGYNQGLNQLNQSRVSNNSRFNSNLASPGVQPLQTTLTRRNQPQFNNTKLQPFQQQQENLNQFDYNNQFPNYQGTTQELNNTDYGNQFQNF